VITRNTFSGATVDRIPLSNFPSFPVNRPPEALVAEFERIVHPMFDQIAILQRTNSNLSAQCDLLLPKLIAGEISVSAPVRELESVA
jgi:type I restriction enzyme S subunit